MLSRKDQIEDGTGRTGRGTLLLVQGGQSRPPALTSAATTWLRPLASCCSLSRKHACLQDLSAPCVLCSLGWSVPSSSLCLKSFPRDWHKGWYALCPETGVCSWFKEQPRARCPWWVMVGPLAFPPREMGSHGTVRSRGRI